MKRINLILFSIVLLLVGTSCEKDRTFVEFEDLEYGAYARQLSREGSFFLTDIPGSQIDVSVEFYDVNQGKDVASYSWTVEYIDKAGNGANSVAPVDFATFNASDFGTSASGLPSVDFTFTLTDALAAVGIAEEDAELGNTFRFNATLTMNDGRTFTLANTGNNIISSAAFRALFAFDADLICPSNLAGEYTSTTTGTSTDPCCPDETTVESTVTITEVAAGVYEISDWSAGLYQEWYEVYGINDDFIGEGGLIEEIKDVCEDISGEFEEPFSTITTITGSVDPATGVITYSWVNGYDDMATVVLTPN